MTDPVYQGPLAPGTAFDPSGRTVPAPAPYGGPDANSPAGVIIRIALELGVDPKLALAIAQQESGFNPNIIGDNGTSFGLFQLHRGGELGTHSQDEVTLDGSGVAGMELNARIALSQVAAVARQHPGWSPGQIAAAAQRPKDQAGYARSVDSIYSGGKFSPSSGVAPGPGVSYGSSGGGAAAPPVPDFGAATPYFRMLDIKARYGALAWALDQPELAPILNKAAQEGWDATNLQAALQNTQWWKTHQAAERQWDQLLSEDPAQAKAILERNKRNLADTAASLGIKIDPARLAMLADQVERLGWDVNDINKALLAEAHFGQAGGQMPGGNVALTEQQIKKMASDYLIPMDDATALDYAQKMLSGQLDAKGLEGALLTQSKALHPQLGDVFTSGVTPGQYFAPYKSIIGNTLEIPGDQVNLLDPKWMKVTSFFDGKTTRPMTLSETAMYARSLPDYTKTSQANDAAAKTAAFLTDKMGATA